jgi:hypothetical protein
MHRIELERRVPPNGILQLTLPLGADEADRLMKITVERINPSQEISREQWSAWVQSMAGSWQGDFERASPGEYEAREPL